MASDADRIRDALIRQWRRIANDIPGIDPAGGSRIDGWTNRELLAHLTVQPLLLRRFIESSSDEEPAMTLTANLCGTHTLATTIDRAARKGSVEGRIDFASALERAVPELRAADLTATVVTVQGSIRLRDYLVTRCVEAVVHGYDFRPPVAPDVEAEVIASDALLSVLAESRPDLLDAARAHPANVWLDIATGRTPPRPPLDQACPLMT